MTCSSAGLARAAELSWSAPASCGDASGVVTQIETLVEKPFATAAKLDFQVHIEHGAGDGWHMALRTRPHATGDSTTREVSGANCEEVKNAAAVMIAMTISGREADSQPEGDSTPPKAAAAAPTSPRAAGRAPASSEAQALRFSLGAGLAFDLGVLPALAPGVEVDLSLRFAGLRLIALGSGFPLQQARLADGVRGGDFGLVLGALLICGERVLGPLLALGCLGFELGTLFVEGVAATVSNESRRVYGPRAELGLVFQITPRAAFWGRLGATLPGRRDKFVLDDRDLVHQSKWVSLRGAIGVEISL